MSAIAAADTPFRSLSSKYCAGLVRCPQAASYGREVPAGTERGGGNLLLDHTPL